jgi:hypothetical protein
VSTGQSDIWVFSGPVFPDHAALTLPAQLVTSVDWERKRPTTITYKVDHGIVLGTIEIPQGYDPSLIPMVVRQQVQGRIDLYGFTEGVAFDFRVRVTAPLSAIENVETLTTRSDSLGVDEKDIARRRDLATRLAAKQVGGKDSAIVRAALADLRLAILEQAHAAYLCYRVAETIRQHFVHEKQTRDASWAAMHDALRTSRSDLDTFSSIATAVRHGEFRDIDRATGQNYLRIASQFVEAFFSYLIARGEPARVST